MNCADLTFRASLLNLVCVVFCGQNQDVVPISSYDTAGSFLILGCNNGSIYYIGESRVQRPLVAACTITPATVKVVFEPVRCAEVSSEDEGQRPAGDRAVPGPD